MSQSSLAGLAVQRHFYGTLNGALTDPILGGTVPVVDQPAENQAFPYVQLCEFPETPMDTFGVVGRKVLAQVDVWIRSGSDGPADGWYQARQIAGQIDVLLNTFTAPSGSDGWVWTLCRFFDSKDRPLPDGMTRAVTLTYECLLEAP